MMMMVFIHLQQVIVAFKALYFYFINYICYPSVFDNLEIILEFCEIFRKDKGHLKVYDYERLDTKFEKKFYLIKREKLF